jgi:hypothetical protein
VAVEHRGQRSLALDHHPVLAALVGREARALARGRHLDHRRIEQRVLAEHAAIGEANLAGGLDHQELGRRGRRQAVDGAARDEQVVAAPVRHRPEVGLEPPGAAVDEQQLVGVGVAEQVRRRRGQGGVADLDVGVLEDDVARRQVVGARGQLAQVVGPRPQRPLDPGPRHRWVRAVEVGVLPEEAVARELLLDRALGDGDVGLGGDLTADVGDVHGRTLATRPWEGKHKVLHYNVSAMNNVAGPMAITLEWARALDALDRAGTLVGAAAQLHKGHTAVLYALGQLEAQTGLALLDRRGYRLRLTGGRASGPRARPPTPGRRGRAGRRLPRDAHRLGARPARGLRRRRARRAAPARGRGPWWPRRCRPACGCHRPSWAGSRPSSTPPWPI